MQERVNVVVDEEMKRKAVFVLQMKRNEFN